MDEAVPVTLKGLDDWTFGTLVGALYRQALVEIGFSPDAHVYDLERGFIERKSKKALAARFVLLVMDFYASLSAIRKKVFLCDFLECGRHYRFWWLEFFDRRDYRLALISVGRTTKERFLTPFQKA